MIKVAIADDHQLILEGLKAILQESPNLNIIFTVDNGKTLLQQLEIEKPDVLLLDIELPDSNGIDLCKIIKQQHAGVKIIALTNHDETVYVKKMMRSGANGYLLKGTDQNTLLAAITTVLKDEQYIDQSIQNKILQETISGKRANAQIKLTKREIEILTLIANECANQEIADKLFLSIRTVESHRLSLSQKLNVKNTVGLVKEAYLRGLVD